MPAASRLGDKASAPADAHGCPACPHPVAGPGVGGSPDVNINGRPTLRVSDPGIHAACCGPNQWQVELGSGTVFINGKPAARIGDATTHCGSLGKLIEGSGDVFIGGPMSAAGGAESKTAPWAMSMVAAAFAVLHKLTDEEDKELRASVTAAVAMIDRAEASLRRWRPADRANFQRWFGTQDSEARDRIRWQLRMSREVLGRVHFANSKFDNPREFAHVLHGDPSHTVRLGPQFAAAPRTGEDSKAGTLLHETSHFDDVGHDLDQVLNNGDSAYGHHNCERLAAENPDHALHNADSYEYFIENARH